MKYFTQTSFYSFMLLIACSSNIFAFNGDPKKTGTSSDLLVVDLIEVVEGTCNGYNLELNSDFELAFIDCKATLAPSIINTGTNTLEIVGTGFENLNGVSTLDLVLLYKAILFGFETPYMALASDVDDDLTISTKDLISLRALILGLNNWDDANGYKIVPLSLDLGSDFDPFNMPELFHTFEFDSADLQDTTFEFIVIKAGDLNGSVVFAPDPNDGVQKVSINYNDQELLMGETTTIKFNMNDEEFLEAVTFELETEGVEILDFKAIGEDAIHKITNNKVAVNFHNKTAKQSVEFELTLKANQNILLSEILQLNTDFFAEAIDKNLTVKGLELKAETTSSVENFSSTDMQLYPNPASDLIRLEFGSETQGQMKSIELFNIQGRAVQQYSTNADYIELDLTQQVLVSGTYMVSIISEGRQYTTRFVKY